MTLRISLTGVCVCMCARQNILENNWSLSRNMRTLCRLFLPRQARLWIIERRALILTYSGNDFKLSRGGAIDQLIVFVYIAWCLRTRFTHSARNKGRRGEYNGGTPLRRIKNRRAWLIGLSPGESEKHVEVRLLFKEGSQS